MMSTAKFPWDSQAQKEGYLSLLLYIRQKCDVLGLDPERAETEAILVLACQFFIQKDHESHEWWTETMGTQIKMLQDEISELKNEVAVLKANP